MEKRASSPLPVNAMAQAGASHAAGSEEHRAWMDGTIYPSFVFSET
jgi:hypothetical protein